MGEKATSIVDSIKKILNEGPKTVNEISNKANINWKTAEQYLELLKDLGVVKEKRIKNTRTFFYLDKDTYFKLYIKDKDKKLISTIYYYIKKFCSEIYNKEPTKTQAYKVIWEFNKKLNHNLPIGWYLYGPCCIQIYNNNEKEISELNSKLVANLKSIVCEFCKYENYELQKKVYEEENENLYKIKEKLMSVKFELESKERMYQVLLDLIKYSPKETVDVVTDFVRATLMLDWSRTKQCFIDYLWRYITLVKFKGSLVKYYDNYLDVYFEEDIDDIKKQTQLYILDLVRHATK